MARTTWSSSKNLDRRKRPFMNNFIKIFLAMTCSSAAVLTSCGPSVTGEFAEESMRRAPGSEPINESGPLAPGSKSDRQMTAPGSEPDPSNLAPGSRTLTQNPPNMRVLLATRFVGITKRQHRQDPLESPSIGDTARIGVVVPCWSDKPLYSAEIESEKVALRPGVWARRHTIYFMAFSVAENPSEMNSCEGSHEMIFNVELEHPFGDNDFVHLVSSSAISAQNATESPQLFMAYTP